MISAAVHVVFGIVLLLSMAAKTPDKKKGTEKEPTQQVEIQKK